MFYREKGKMGNNHNEYILDFVIPIGATGPSGITGPTGSMNLLNPIIFVTYDDSTIYNVSLPILNTTSLYDNEQVFTEQSGLIHINQSGYYKFTISGLLKEQLDQNSSLILRNRIRDGTAFKDIITAKLNTEEYIRYFSYTKMAYFNVPQAILVILNKKHTSGASLEQVNLIIQKITDS